MDALRKDLEALVFDSGFSIEEIPKQRDAAKTRLGELESAGKGGTKRAEQAREWVELYDKILSLQASIADLETTSAALAEKKSRLQKLLEESGYDLTEVDGELARQRSELARLQKEGRGESAR